MTQYMGPGARAAAATDSLDFGWNGDVGSGAYFDTKVVPKYVDAPALVRQPHPHDLVEAAWPAQGC
jgi:hypothetical protein